MLAHRCLSDMGRKRVDEIAFTTDRLSLKQLLGSTAEFMTILQSRAPFPTDGYIDMTGMLERAVIEGTWMEPEQLMDFRVSLVTISECLRFLKSLDISSFPLMHGMIEGLTLEARILREIDRIIDEKGRIRDRASDLLAQIRRDMELLGGTIDRKINQVLNLTRRSGWSSENATPTIRNGRLVIPLHVPHKRKIRGFIHDESATGQTVYIEPEEVFDANNRIRELESAEHREIVRILAVFTGFIRPHIPELLRLYVFLGEIDLVRSKALFADEINAILPDITEKPLIDWRQAVHPLLFLTLARQHRVTVPSDIQLDDRQRILVLSGPNAGGKSVCLKTIGLLQYMFQCGLLIPVAEGSTCGIFEHIFIDIGDEQSLENDLSTYSSHLMNYMHFMEHAGPGTLFLIDEFGSGTDPQMGGAIAEVVLERLAQSGAFGAVTTHYFNLKALAGRTDGIINGAMLFDTRAMTPLFRLQTGHPGSSFAFEIARRIGFPLEMLDEAGSRIGTGQVDFERQIQLLEAERRDLARRQQQYQVADGFLNETITKYEQLLQKLEAEKGRILGDARSEAAGLLESVNRLIEQTIKEIRESQADKEKTKRLREKITREKERIIGPMNERKKAKPAVRKKRETAGDTEEAGQPLMVGDWVRIADQDVAGEIIEITGEDAVVRCGSFTLRTDTGKLHRTDVPPPEQNPAIRKPISSGLAEQVVHKAVSFNPTFDVRGKRGEEALNLVRRFIDDAILLNIPTVRILHGKGYGILRSLIHDFLKGIPEITTFRDEHIERGGHGITIVEFRK